MGLGNCVKQILVETWASTWVYTLILKWGQLEARGRLSPASQGNALL